MLLLRRRIPAFGACLVIHRGVRSGQGFVEGRIGPSYREERRVGSWRTGDGIHVQRALPLFPEHHGICSAFDAITSVIFGGLIDQESVGDRGRHHLVPESYDFCPGRWNRLDLSGSLPLRPYQCGRRRREENQVGSFPPQSGTATGNRGSNSGAPG